MKFERLGKVPSLEAARFHRLLRETRANILEWFWVADNSVCEMNKLLRVASCLFAFALFGCATSSKVTKIDAGMTRAQVASTIGRPYKKESFRDSKGNLIETWSYQETTWDDGGWSWNRTIVRSDVTFVNGIVNNIGTGADTHLRDNPVLPVVYALQNQEAINAYNNRTQVLAQPVDVNVRSTVDENINANVQVHQY